MLDDHNKIGVCLGCVTLQSVFSLYKMNELR